MHAIFELMHCVSCVMIWNAWNERAVPMWEEHYEPTCVTAAYGTALAEAFVGESAQSRVPLELCGLAHEAYLAGTLYASPITIGFALLIACTAAVVASAAPRGTNCRYNCYTAANILAIFFNVCVWLYVYSLYMKYEQIMCSSGMDETACPGYVEPPPPPAPGSNSCHYAYDGDCDEGTTYCSRGTDAYDCRFQPPPPPPPSPSPSAPSHGTYSGTNHDDPLTDEQMQLMWIGFTHLFVSIFRGVASFTLCCCKGAPPPPSPSLPSQFPAQMLCAQPAVSHLPGPGVSRTRNPSWMHDGQRCDLESSGR
jgi:hypothetical protein